MRPLSDAELVVAQGKENNERRDLSFIERALFAAHLEERGFDRGTIQAALGVDKPEVSRLISVATTISSDLILAIGPAPKVGRPRWLTVADRLSDSIAAKKVKAVLSSDSFRASDSDAFPADLRRAPTPAVRGFCRDLQNERRAYSRAS